MDGTTTMYLLDDDTKVTLEIYGEEGFKEHLKFRDKCIAWKVVEGLEPLEKGDIVEVEGFDELGEIIGIQNAGKVKVNIVFPNKSGHFWCDYDIVTKIIT